MRLETCIRKGLGLKAHRVKEVREEAEGPLVAEVERIAGRSLRCGCCGGPARQIHSRQKERQWRDLSVRDRPLVLRYAPVRVFCRRCGVKVELAKQKASSVVEAGRPLRPALSEAALRSRAAPSPDVGDKPILPFG